MGAVNDFRHQQISVGNVSRLLTSPHQQSRIVRAQLQEVFSVYCKKSAGMRWALIWLGVVGSSLLFSLWDFIFFVKHSPLEDASVVMTVCVNRSVLEVLVVNPVNDRDRHDCAVAIDWSEKWRQPIFVYFAVCVKVDDHFTCGFLCTSKKYSKFQIRSVSEMIPTYLERVLINPSRSMLRMTLTLPSKRLT